MSMKDLLSKMTELQGTVESVEVAPVTATGKKVLNESSNTMKESTKPSLKSIFSSLLSEAEQVTIQPAKQNTQVIKQGQKTLGTVENPQLAQQIKQSIGKGEMTLAGDELGEAKVTDSRVNEIRQLAKQFFGVDPYSSARIDNGKMLRLSFRLPEMNEYRYVPLDSIDSKDKQTLKDIKNDFLQYMAKKGVSSEEVDMKFHVGSGIYASVRIAIPQKTTEPNLAESKLTEKAVSKSQQQAAGAALAAKRGDAPKSKLTGASKEMAKMSTKELEKFAGTKHKGLPDKKEKTDESSSGVRIVHNKLLGGWFIVRGPHQTPISGKFSSKEEAQQSLKQKEKPTANEAAMPTHDGDFGAGLGAGRNSKTLEAKKAKPDFLDLDKDGNKKESMKKAAADKQKVSTMKKTNEAKAKPDFLDLDKDGDKKESMKKAAADKKPGSDDKKSSAGLTAAQKKLPAGLQKAVAKKKTVKEGANPTEAARLLGKAHAMGKDPFACKYEAGTPEAQAYLDGYKEGLDECYGSGGGMGMQQDIGMMPGMDSMVSQDSMLDSPSPRGGSEFAFGGFDEVSDDDMMAFESWDRELNALLNEAVTPKFQVRYLPNNRDTYKIEKGFASKKEAQDWIKGENLRDRAEDISIETSTSKEVNEGKMKDIDIDMKQMSDAQFKKEHGKSKADMKKDLSSDTKKPVKEGISVSVSKGQQGAPDSVSVTAQDGDADALLAMIKQAGLGLFGGDEPSGYGSPAAATQPVGDIGDHDSMMALIKKMSSTGNDYEDEESQDDQHVHGHPDAACGVCGSSDCGCNDESDSKALVVGEEQGYDDKEDESLGMRTGKESGKEQSMKDRRDDSYGKFGKRTDEDESEDQMEFEVAESNAPDSGEAETTADENAEAKEDQALAGAMSGDEEEIDEGSCSMDEEEELTEWANDAGYEGSENIKDNTFEQDIEFMTRIISGGLNGPKKDQTTLPHTRVKVDESRQAINEWKKLSGIK